MDSFDQKILQTLQKDNRITSATLGQKIGLSATACQRRIKKLRASGVIAKEVAILNPNQLGEFITVVVEVTLKKGGADVIDNFKDHIKKSEAVQQCYYVTGSADFVLIICTKNMAAYETFTRKHLLTYQNIQKFHSTIVMENVKQGLELPI